jgi:hypothetical protein
VVVGRRGWVVGAGSGGVKEKRELGIGVASKAALVAEGGWNARSDPALDARRGDHRWKILCTTDLFE